MTMPIWQKPIFNPAIGGPQPSWEKGMESGVELSELYSAAAFRSQTRERGNVAREFLRSASHSAPWLYWYILNHLKY